ATVGDELTRGELCQEAIRLARVLISLIPEQAEIEGLLALMLLQDSRANARTGVDGRLLTLEMQDRSLWKRDRIREGTETLEQALKRKQAGPYQLQAAIAAVHAQASRPQDTDWPEIVALYAELYRSQPSPIVRLNQAVAVAMAEGPEQGLAIID